MRIVWLLIIETSRKRDAGGSSSPALIRWAVIGFAVVGVSAIIIAKVGLPLP